MFASRQGSGDGLREAKLADANQLPGCDERFGRQFNIHSPRRRRRHRRTRTNKDYGAGLEPDTFDA